MAHKGISVIIPTYNRQKYVVQAIESVLDQDYDGNIEIIVSDDGSTDHTLDLLESYSGRVQFLSKAEDCITQGASGARNRGIKASGNQYICFLDSDDFFLPGHLHKMVAAIESEKELGFAFCRLLEMDENKDKNLFRLWSKEDITARDIAHLTLSKHNVIQTNGFIFKKEVFERVGLFDENLSNGEDNDLWMRISEVHKGTFADHYGAVIRKHGEGQLTDTAQKELREVYIDIFERAIKRYKSLEINDLFRIIKLYYVVIKYKALGVSFLEKVIGVVEKRKNGTDEDLKWKPLSHFKNTD